MATRDRSRGAGNTGDNPHARKSANTEQLLLRRAKSMRLRLEGKTFRDIAAEVGVNESTVRKDILSGMAEYMRDHEAETIPRLRALELQRIDHAVVEVYKILNTRSGTELALKAVDRLARLINLRSELLGLKVPIEVNMKKIEVTQTDLELAEIIREAELQNEAVRMAILEEAATDGGAATVA